MAGWQGGRLGAIHPLKTQAPRARPLPVRSARSELVICFKLCSLCANYLCPTRTRTRARTTAREKRKSLKVSQIRIGPRFGGLLAEDGECLAQILLGWFQNLWWLEVFRKRLAMNNKSRKLVNLWSSWAAYSKSPEAKKDYIYLYSYPFYKSITIVVLQCSNQGNNSILLCKNSPAMQHLVILFEAVLVIKDSHPSWQPFSWLQGIRERPSECHIT